MASPRPKRRWRRALLACIILLSGVVIGAGAATFIVPKWIMRATRGSERGSRAITSHLQRGLDLSDQQAGQVDAIVARRLREVRRILEQNRPQVVEQLELMENEVAAVLDDAQAKKWRARLARIRKMAPFGASSCGRRGSDHKRATPR